MKGLVSTMGAGFRSTPSPTSAIGWRRREGELAARAVELRDATAEILGPDAALPVLDVARPWRTAGVVAGTLQACIEAMRHSGELEAPGVHALCTVVPDLQRLASELAEHDVHLRGRRLAECEDGLARLRALPSSGDLLDQACEVLVRRCGFGRAMLSRVVDDTWRPWTVHFGAEPPAAPWFREWANRRIPFQPDGAEARALHERRPVLAADAGPGVGPLVYDACEKTSFVVAPLIRDDRVIGLLHADHHPSERRVDETDRQLVWRYAEGFAQVYERAVLTERLDDQRDRVREALASTKRMMDELRDTGMGFGQPVSVPAPSPVVGPERAAPAPAAGVDALTARERDVLELMLTGAGNHAIAEQLVIAPGTVKFHVQNILRKLGAVNRAQAIASCLHLRPARQG
ncbi:LuxR C-terminal-related transcriptional regulator [Patulibacter sp. NPDC049589]|uniref:LuxR C-terminal-related transcriptional regulator n=1 Tax=Patulibacter sp. NPDC049589 TaxID=3154731 RepID=UPI00344A75C9